MKIVLVMNDSPVHVSLAGSADILGAAIVNDDELELAKTETARYAALLGARVIAIVPDTWRSLADGLAEAITELQRELDAEQCPGCGCRPGDGKTPGCHHPGGCGFEP